MAKGSAVGLPSPDPHAQYLGIRAEYRGGNWPNTRNPAGVPTGFGLAASGGMLPKLASGQRGSGGRAVQLALFSRATVARGSGPAARATGFDSGQGRGYKPAGQEIRLPWASPRDHYQSSQNEQQQ